MPKHWRRKQKHFVTENKTYWLIDLFIFIMDLQVWKFWVIQKFEHGKKHNMWENSKEVENFEQIWLHLSWKPLANAEESSNTSSWPLTFYI